jgi:ABC-type glycerol-3-phosphate transport system substrate-binding protein
MGMSDKTSGRPRPPIHFNRRRLLGAALTIPAIVGVPASRTGARAAGTIQMISHRYPALEYYAEKMRGAIPGVTVNTQLMPIDKAMELATIALSSKSDTPDIVYASDTTMQNFVKNGWFRPLDDLWAKYRDEFKLDDFPAASLAPYRVDGHLYVMPHTVNAMMFFYRKDLFDKTGKSPPKTIVEFRDLAKSFNTPMRSGTISCLKPVDAATNEIHWYLNALGDGWFDKDWHPTFNTEKSVASIEMLKEVTKYAQQGFTAAANDECMIALQQDTAAMGLQWATRAKAMDDPAKSRVVNEIDWVAPPQGHARISGDGYAISAFSKQDPDTLFRIIATSASQASMRGAASLLIPPRKSILDDPEMAKANRFYPAALASYESGTRAPSLPEFNAICEFVTRRVLQGVTGETTVKLAMDTAATETETFLKGHGYYK